MVLHKSAERKRQEAEALQKLREEKAKEEEVCMQWRIFMHSRAELAEMERREKIEEEKKKVDTVKRRLEFKKDKAEKKEKEEEEKRRKLEKASRKQKTPVKKGRKIEEITIFSSSDKLPPKAK